jgi:DNA-directed RNA polymerase specialized sigma24 family protein
MEAFDRDARVEPRLSETFTSFVEEVEPRLKRALCVAVGIERGVEATADALAYGWEHWERVEVMENPAGYLYRVGRSRARTRRVPKPDFPAYPTDISPWVEPALPAALGRLSEAQRQAVWLVHGYEWGSGSNGAETAMCLAVALGVGGR